MLDRRRARRDEDEAERLDRELLELLNELRVVMPGVQLLFGLLLTVPFQQGFHDIDGFQRITYFVTLLLTAAAAAFLMGPSAFHRLTFRHGQRPYLVELGTRQTIIGMAFVALAMNGAILLLTDLLFHALTVVLVVAGTTSLFGWLWFGLALRRRASGKREW
jgi:high-affinity Fe2+/Pb2+ permease